MKCPTCDHQLTEMSIYDITLDVCKGGCAGIWFDRYELQKMDEKHEPVNGELFTIPRNPQLSVDHAQRRHCPRCREVVMMRHYYSVKHEVEVDECGGCGGFWLDQGELEKIRSLYDSPEDERKNTRKFLAQQFSKNLADLEKQNDLDAQRARKFASLFRFICPSYLILGKQEGAAF